jgi:hypothetical protein
MSRKTVDILGLLEYANYQLSRQDEHASRDFKRGIASMIETILQLTGNYEGFGYLHDFIDNKPTQWDSPNYWNRVYHYSNKLRQEKERANTKVQPTVRRIIWESQTVT